MANILIMPPYDIMAISASRGDGAANLLRPSPREIWQDSASGSPVSVDIDLGTAQVIDTVFLGFIWYADAGATWSITGGLAAYDQITLASARTLCAPSRAGQVGQYGHAFWTGAQASIRYLRIIISQPAGKPAIAIGTLCAGAAWQPIWNTETGGGRGVKDTGTLTRLPSGGVSVVEGARYGTYKFTLGDLTDDEVDYLYDLQLALGETRRVLVVEDPEHTPGLRSRIHYGAFTGLRAFERRDPNQTRWEATIEDWG